MRQIFRRFCFIPINSLFKFIFKQLGLSKIEGSNEFIPKSYYFLLWYAVRIRAKAPKIAAYVAGSGT